MVLKIDVVKVRFWLNNVGEGLVLWLVGNEFGFIYVVLDKVEVGILYVLFVLQNGRVDVGFYFGVGIDGYQICVICGGVVEVVVYFGVDVEFGVGCYGECQFG